MGVVHSNLCSVRRIGSIELSVISSYQLESTTVHMALINASSVVNKTFILNGFYVTHGLRLGADMSSLAELFLPPRCNVLSTLTTTRPGGGLAAIFYMIKCKLLHVESFKSFEV